MSDTANAPLKSNFSSPKLGIKLIDWGALPQIKITTQNKRIKSILSAVKINCTLLLALREKQWIIVSATTSDTAEKVLGISGNTADKYAPKVIAARATGAAKPTVADTHPEMNPAQGW